MYIFPLVYVKYDFTRWYIRMGTILRLPYKFMEFILILFFVTISVCNDITSSNTTIIQEISLSYSSNYKRKLCC